MPERIAPAAQLLLGDEAVALAALHAGITAAYAYPGTPSTEIVEALIAQGTPNARWCANEKTAYEEALGVSMAGRRVLVAMKHVGLNVAADPFMNSAVVAPKGGLVVAVADDPGMHSSQNEQDSRFYADFARIPCLEPADPQQAYDMTREAFEVSEHFRMPVLLRLVTRVAHQKALVRLADERDENDVEIDRAKNNWVLLPAFARKRWQSRLEQQQQIREWSEASRHGQLSAGSARLGVITTGIARSYYLEAARELHEQPAHLHIATYPIPMDKVRQLVASVSEVLVIEEGYPFVERLLRGIVPPPVKVRGRQSGEMPEAGELNTDLVRAALGLAPRTGMPSVALPERPPRLCDGCPHIDAFTALGDALQGYATPLVMGDIGCYTLGALPPYEIGDSCVCMGASIGMAKGASEAGVFPAVAIIGDSTFLHSGITPLLDVVAHHANVTVLILDNHVVAMTGAQPTLMPPGRLQPIVLGTGIDPAHCHVFQSHPKKVAELTELLRREIAFPGPSVVIVERECVEAAKKNKRRG
ncbi:MAG TPA: thiamine pyrophosphate-dependent enzyme [Thermoanaerobaculia bacterium]|nr:thiamine pyrophosphate-dependent enzyme [Thermoanaerobaculia bacterium]